MVLMQNLIDAVERLKKKFPNVSLQAIEFGTIRVVEQGANCQSTACISHALGECGDLVSVDINEGSIKASKEVCCNSNNIEWIQSDSIAYLKELKDFRGFHFVFLDTVNDREFVFEEFCLVAPMMIKDGILIVDDAGIKEDGNEIDRNVNAQKGHRIWEFLKRFGIEFRVLPYPNFPGTQLEIVFDSANTIKIITSLIMENKI